MKRMKDNIIQICKMTEDELFKFLVKFVQKNYERSVVRPGYIIAEGDIPVCLVAHLDTVFKTTPIIQKTSLYYTHTLPVSQSHIYNIQMEHQLLLMIL